MIEAQVGEYEHVGGAYRFIQGVRPCKPLGIGARSDRRDLGGYRRPDIIPEYQWNRRGKIDEPPECENLDDSYRRAAALQQHRYRGADQQPEDGISAEIHHQIPDTLVGLEGREGILHESYADEQDPESEQHFTPLPMILAPPHHHDNESQADRGQRIMADLENCEETHDPGRDRRADIRAEHHRYGLSECQESRVDKADHHYRHGAAALYERRDPRSHEERDESVPRK